MADEEVREDRRLARELRELEASIGSFEMPDRRLKTAGNGLNMLKRGLKMMKHVANPWKM